MFFVLAGGLTAPVTGVLVDRLAVRQARSLPLILTAFAIAPLFFLDGHPVLELVYLIGFLYGLLSGMAEAAQTVLIKVIFDDAQLVAVNSVHQTLNRGLRVVAPLLGATRCADRGSPGVQTPGTAPPAGRHRGRRSVRSLLSQLLRDRGTANGDGRAEPPGRVPRSSRYRAGLRHDRHWVLLARYGRDVAVETLMAAGLCCFTASALLQATSSLSLVVLAMVVAGAGLPMCIVSMATTVQRCAPPGDVGKVHGATSLVVGVPQAVGVAVGAALVASLDYRVVCLLIAVGLLATAACTLYGGRSSRRQAAPEPAGVG